MRLARITLDVYAVLPEGKTAAGLADGDVRSILDTALYYPRGGREPLHLGDAGGFGQQRGWCGVYTVDREEIETNETATEVIR